MFDAGARCGDAAVTLFLPIGQALDGVAFALDVHTPAGLFERGFPLGGGVATIGIDIPACVGAIKQRFEYRGVSHGGMRDGHFAHQLVALVHAGVQLVAKVILAVLFCPTRVDVLLCPLVRLPSQRHRALFDGVSFLALVALNRCLYQRRIDDLAAARQVTVLMQLFLDLLEHASPRASLRQTVPKQPDRLGIGNTAALGQIQKLQEASAVKQLVFQRVIGQVVELLEYQYLDHQHRWIRRASALGARRPWRSGINARR